MRPPLERHLKGRTTGGRVGGGGQDGDTFERQAGTRRSAARLRGPAEKHAKGRENERGRGGGSRAAGRGRAVLPRPSGGRLVRGR